MQGIDRSIGNGGQEYPPFRCSLDTAYYPNAFNLMALMIFAFSKLVFVDFNDDTLTILASALITA